MSVAKLTPEFHFLLLAYQSQNGGSRQLLHRFATAELDWSKIVAGMGLHGFLWLAEPLLAEGLPPPPAAVELRRRARTQAIETLQRIDEVVRVSRALEAQNIRFLILKGAPLSVQLHGNPTRRAARDLDILVERHKRAEADVLLTSLGYAIPRGSPAPENPGRPAKEVGYVHCKGGTLVEVHDRLTDNFELLPWEFEVLWADREAVPVGGRHVTALNRRRLPLYLCVHGAKHGWSRLLWLDDLAAALAAPGAAEQALLEATPLGLRGAVLHSLGLLHDWLGLPVSAAILTEAHASRQVRLIDGVVAKTLAWPNWWQQPGRGSWRRFWRDSVQRRLLTYALKPRWSYWRRQFAQELFSPDDRRWLALPPWLAWLYLPFRPVGWLLRRLKPAG